MGGDVLVSRQGGAAARLTIDTGLGASGAAPGPGFFLIARRRENLAILILR